MITVQEARTVMEPVAIQVPQVQTVQALQVHQKIVEYERPRMIPGKLIRTVAGPTQTIGVTQAQAQYTMPTQTQYTMPAQGQYTMPMMYGYPGMGSMMQGQVPNSASAGPGQQMTNV